MAATSGKIVKNVFVSHSFQQNTQLFASQSQGRRDYYFAPYPRNSNLPSPLGKLAWTASSMQLRTLYKPQNHFSIQRNFHCNASASASATALPYLDKTDFLKLQNGSDIRGVAVDGVEGEKVNLTETVAEAIGAAFAAWLVEKKRVDPSQHLRVSIGHDSRISAQLLQNAVSRGLAGAGLEVVHYGARTGLVTDIQALKVLGTIVTDWERDRVNNAKETDDGEEPNLEKEELLKNANTRSKRNIHVPGKFKDFKMDFK